MIRFLTPTADARQPAGATVGASAVENAAAGEFATVVEVSAAVRLDGADKAASPILCHCLQVTEAMVDEAISAGVVQSLRDVIVCTGAGDGCTACRVALRAYLARRGVAG